MDTQSAIIFNAILKYDIDIIKIISPKLSLNKRRECICYIFENAHNGKLDFEMYQNLMIDSNDINYSSPHFGLPLNCVISRGEYEIAKEMITKWSANIFIISNNSQRSPMDTLLNYSIDTQQYYDLITILHVQDYFC
jgi:hypothetical protein